jgi:hypothetical protein
LTSGTRAKISRCEAFHDASDLGWSVGENGLDEKVNKVFVCADLKKVDPVTIGNVSHASFRIRSIGSVITTCQYLVRQARRQRNTLTLWLLWM